MNKKFRVITIFIVTLLLLTTVAYGASNDLPYTNSNNDIEINTDEMPPSSHVFMGNNVNIKADFDTLIIVQGLSVTLDGNYNGDVFVFANDIELHGNFNKNVYVFAQNYNSDANIEGTMYSFSRSGEIIGGELEEVVGFFEIMEIRKDVTIKRDLIAFGSILELIGDTSRNVNANVNSLYLKGNVDGDIDAVTDVFEIGDTASVDGKISNTSENKVIVSEGADITNEIKQTFVKSAKNTVNYLSLIITAVASFLIILTLIKSTAVRFYSKSEFYYRKKLLNVFLSGTIFLFAFAFVAIALVFINPKVGMAFILASSALIMVSQLIAFVMAVPTIAKMMKLKDLRVENSIASLIAIVVYVALSLTTGIVMSVFKLTISIVGIGLVIYNIRFSRKEFIYEQRNIIINTIQENTNNPKSENADEPENKNNDNDEL